MNIYTAPANYRPHNKLLQGKTLLVTGAGDGIGRAAALCYARYGATVILLGRTGSKLEAVYDEIEASGGPKPALVELDLATANEENCINLASGLAGEFEHLDGLLHNAGVLGERRPIESAGYSAWQEVMQVNVNAQFLLTRHLLPLLRRRPAPRLSSPHQVWAAPAGPTGAPTRYPNSPPRDFARCWPANWKTPLKFA